MNETREVVVVGAGPVGLMLACELRLGGVDVLVVERLAEPDRTVKAGAINVPTAQAMYRRGLLPELRAEQETAGAASCANSPASSSPASVRRSPAIRRSWT
ncbi:FAD-dependent monooxygenase [Nocardia sp. NPDC005745]|uniref:FAD-dependent monooxygenase n=1 Tax=Nocardia sp. NPDC005745 TaxID=3157061 RepID=UPI0034010CFF